MKVSVIIPVYNTEKYVLRCLDSILHQTLQDFEIVVVNDLSPDQAMNIVYSYAQRDERIRIVENPKNMGLMWTRYEGYRRALGDYIVFCDSDDYLPCDALDILYSSALSENADIVVSSYTYVDISEQSRIVRNYISDGDSPVNAYHSLFNKQMQHSLWAKIYSRSLFSNFEYQVFVNQTNAEDFILFYQLVQNANKIICIDNSTYNYCQNLTSSTQTIFTDSKVLSLINALNWEYKFFKDNPLYIELLNKDELDKLHWLFQLGCKKSIMQQMTSDFLEKINFSFVRQYMGVPKALFFILLYHCFFIRKVCFYYGECKRALRVFVDRWIN